MQHGLRRPFARALRDAFFIPDPEDKASIEDFLKMKEVSWEHMLFTHPNWLLRRVRRFVPPPEELLPRVQAVLRGYGPLKDAITGLPLFNDRAWNVVEAALENIRRGYYSDPPGIPLYYSCGRDKYGLFTYRCVRGTNGIEGGIHQNIIRRFGSFNAAPDFAVELLRDYTFCHNLRVGTRNRTGSPYHGSFDIWTKNRLCHLLDVTSNSFTTPPLDFDLSGWINGNRYVRSTETFGIMHLPEKYRSHVTVMGRRSSTNYRNT
ncbi:hypothetical protein A0H81_13618 [Grifola frondosa]|uniref:Uncharacterized protein n=1 Tax=Grifola frondosa TaxID=5627 RepID=A0A1C7LRA2_GRIFR|nr:hypothetical protein A0H81_13618 [Grifola frondosa]